jgi:signal transduction histidine kinase
MGLSEFLQIEDDTRGSVDPLAAVLFDNSVLAVLNVSLTGEILQANTTLLKLLGVGSLSELRRRVFKTDVLAAPAEWQPWKRAATSGRVIDQEIRCMARGGEEIVLKGEIRRVEGRHGDRSLVGLFTDVTRFKQIQVALQRTARMEMVGGLTSGIAHDFNNLLTVLVGNLYLVAEGVRDNPPLFEKTKRARDAAKRGADLTRQLLSFAREDNSGTGLVDPGKLIKNLEPLLARALGSKIKLETKVDSDVASINANAAQLESVLVNLAINARDAINGDGVIAIEAGNATLDTERSLKLGLPQGRYVRIAVADDGPGIPDAVQARIFEPFFSTKGKMQGTGLGLSMVRWFVDEAGGGVSFTTDPAAGTTFVLLLPCAARAPGDTTTDMTMPLSTLPTGTETILVLANDAQLRLMIQESLEILGYSVRWDADPSDLNAMKGAGKPDLIMVDYAAPAAVKVLNAAGGSIPVIGIKDTSNLPIGARGAAVTISKPFTLFDLASTVRRTLDGDLSDQS